MIVNSMAQISDKLMITGSDDTTLRLTRFNDEIVNLLTLRSHISSIRSICCLTLEPNLYIIVTAGGRAQLKVWVLNTSDEGSYYRIYFMTQQLLNFVYYSYNRCLL